ncbi:MAG: hypothetical protein H5T63_10200 [Chloroflexi bacterium]|nr:hypothetical protein [Chloroflexota bacterium]
MKCCTDQPTARVRIPRLRLEHLWIALPAVAVAWMGLMHPLRMLDFWWHLKAGEVIVTTGQIPRVDLFSFTQTGEPFILQNWLGEVLYYLIYRAGGLPLLITFNTALLLATFFLILRLSLEATSKPRIASLGSLVAALVLGWYSNSRPQVYSFVFFALFYWILWGYRERRRDFLWALPLVMLLWVNLHGAFILGIGLIVIVLATEALRRAWHGQSIETLTPRELAKLALVLCLTSLACLANPEGYGVFTYVRQLQVDPASQQLVTEWQVPNIKELSGILCFFGPFFLTLLVFLYSRRRLGLTELGLFLAFAIFGLAAIRNGIWFALISAPMLARHLSELEIPPHHTKMPLLARLQAWLQHSRQRQTGRKEAYWLNWAILTCLILLTVLLSPWVRVHLKVERLRPELVEQGTPVGAVEYIAEHHLTGNIFHPQRYGDYLIWRLWPEQSSFIDGRVHLYPLSFVQDYILVFHDEHWEARLAKYDIQYLLLAKEENAERMIADARNSERWTLLYEDDLSVLFAKKPSSQ